MARKRKRKKVRAVMVSQGMRWSVGVVEARERGMDKSFAAWGKRIWIVNHGTACLSRQRMHTVKGGEGKGMQS